MQLGKPVLSPPCPPTFGFSAMFYYKRPDQSLILFKIYFNMFFHLACKSFETTVILPVHVFLGFCEDIVAIIEIFTEKQISVGCLCSPVKNVLLLKDNCVDRRSEDCVDRKSVICVNQGFLIIKNYENFVKPVVRTCQLILFF